MAELEKKCSCCQVLKPLGDFHNARGQRDGKAFYCKACTKQKSADRYLKNRESILARNKAWDLANPDKRRAISRRSEAKNPEKRRQQARELRQKDPEKQRQYSRKHYAKNPEARIASSRKWRLRNKANVAAADKARREANIERYIERERAYDQANREARKLKNKRWQQANPHKVAAHAAKRRAVISERTPKWLTEQDFDVIDWYYASAKMAEVATGIPHQVDHVIPLQGKRVSGLHVPNNLQVIPASENLKKSNHWSVE